MSRAMQETRSAIDSELRTLNATLSLAAATSSLMHNSDVYGDRDKLALNTSLKRNSPLKTVNKKTGLSAAHNELVNQLGNTLSSSGGLPLDVTGKVAPDAELQVLARSGVLETPEQMKATAKAMTTRDTINTYLHMEDKPLFETDYRRMTRQNAETAQAFASPDKGHVASFKLDEYKLFVEAANRYHAWPPENGVPPWPVKKD